MLLTSLKHHILLTFYVVTILIEEKCFSAEVRLVGGSNNNKGRVEVYIQGEWGTICDDDWDINDARVVCRQVGFADAIYAPHAAYFGEGSGDIMYDDVACTGNESDISSCPNSGLRFHDCSHYEDASVICTKVRLVGGSNINEGRVEVYVEGEWGTICDDLWDITDARVVCRQVGFPDAIDAPQSAHFGEGCGDIMYNGVACTGNESDITSCPNSGLRSHNCVHHEDASVICTSKVRLVGGSNNKEGRVEVYIEGEWGTICDDSWDINDARVVCRQLGFPDAIDAPPSAHFGEGSGDIMYDDVACTGNENDITSCPNSGLRSHNCAHFEDASVICTSNMTSTGYMPSTVAQTFTPTACYNIPTTVAQPTPRTSTAIFKSSVKLDRLCQTSKGSCIRCAIACLRALQCKSFRYDDKSCHLMSDFTNDEHTMGNYKL
ncbi:deleted in malignant brain tumors 1 protein-like [Anneissia japonica]|uniref:deleted in malignant brain tumors 1 protein-like n=1 Tax=Anneissia japonica TaxID=1529436 RepID=UPI0014254EF4|nr:deleted in malignant brain tumors 1 protein-like [Anneissia japonica]